MVEENHNESKADEFQHETMTSQLDDLFRLYRETERDEITQKCASIEEEIRNYSSNVSARLGGSPKIQKECVSNLWNATRSLSKVKLYLHMNLADAGSADIQQQSYKDAIEGLNDAIYYKSLVDIELAKTKSRDISYKVIAATSILVIIIVSLLYLLSGSAITIPADQLNGQTIMGIPLTVIFWSFVGSLTGALFGAGEIFFNDIGAGAQWIMYRSMTGIVMGIMLYLLLITGMIMITGAGTSSIKVPETIWVIAFLGGFIEILTPDLLKKVAKGITTNDQGGKSSNENLQAGGNT